MRAGDLFKIGKTKNPKRRIKDALTWIPDIEVVAMKPFWNISALERMIHEGLSEPLQRANQEQKEKHGCVAAVWSHPRNGPSEGARRANKRFPLSLAR
jgi:hypothetical protein